MARTRRKINPLAPETAVAVPQERIYRAGGYIRLSVEDSGHPGSDTIEAQESLVSGYIQSQSDMAFVRLFCDNGRTGTNFERPGFEALMEDVRAGKIDCIVVKDLSRFGRNYLETGMYLERLFPYLNVRFVAVNDHFDTLTAERSADGYIIPLKNMMNEAYSDDISRKSSSALAIKQRSGEFIGSWAPYGYQKSTADRHKLEIDPETAPVVRMIFQWRVSGISYQQIARRLNEQGIPAPARYHYMRGEVKSERLSKSIWHVAMVKKLLSSEMYLGHMVQGQRRTAFSQGRKSKKVPESEWVIVRNTHEPLINEETFFQVKEMRENDRAVHLERRGKYDKLGTEPNILRGLVFCADCKKPMIRYKNVSVNAGNRYYTYICVTHAENPTACPLKGLREETLREILWSALKQEIALAESLEKLTRPSGRSTKASTVEASLEQEAVGAQKALERTKRLHDSLFQSYTDRLVTEEEYVSMKEQYRADIVQAQVRLEEIEQRKRELLQKTVENPWLTAFGQFRGEASLTEAMAHTLIERVEVDAENHVAVMLRYRDEYRALVRFLEEAV